MISAVTILLALGAVCLLASGLLMYKMMPREGEPPPGWMKTEGGETAWARSQYSLMSAGLAWVA